MASEQLGAIEQELVQAAELYLSGAIKEPLYNAMLRGSLAVLPKPAAPEHVLVLKRLKL